ncbi:MAG TPA: hypothetical protein DCK97_16560 [Tistrella mobilis]|uniref:HTH tetR-type domain-containing protein n=1 Tax=Tistrella mobilis TaxID=171437 RepID=A0A3B9IMF8_9PROT|nr:hypothetical protein [Tistrella mobilis]
MVGEKNKRCLMSAEERKAHIVCKAACLFARRGFAGTTSAALAKECGVSEALIYKLFKNKQGLYQAIVEAMLRSWDPLELDAEDPRELEAVLTDIAERIFAQTKGEPDFVRLLYHSELDQSEVAALFLDVRAGQSLGALAGYFSRRRDLGELRDDLDPRMCAASFLSMTWHYAIGLHVFDRGRWLPGDEPELIRTFAAIFSGGLRA